MARTILVIDDENNMRWVLERALQKAGYEVVTAARGDEGLRAFARHAIDLVLLDLKMPGMDGLSVLREIRQRTRHVPIFLLTAYATVPTAVEALKIGATDYVRKPFDLEALQTKISYALNAVTGPITAHAESEQSVVDFVGIAPSVARLRSLGEAAAQNDYPILISGEVGSGRNLLARFVQQKRAHSYGSTSDENCQTLDCAVLPKSILEIELGTLLKHERKRTDARTGDLGERWEQALGGTLVIANIDALPTEWIRRLCQNIQPYLRAPQCPHGLRLICTYGIDTNSQLDVLLPQAICLKVPALRDRREDLQLLMAHFAPQLSWAKAARMALNVHDWPGNVAELKQTIEYAQKLSNGTQIEISHLPPAFNLSTDPSTTPHVAKFELPPDGINLEEVERSLIEQALERTGGNKTQAARLLGISRSTLLYRLEKHGIDG